MFRGPSTFSDARKRSQSLAHKRTILIFLPQGEGEL
jgi:hypothetical protein